MASSSTRSCLQRESSDQSYDARDKRNNALLAAAGDACEERTKALGRIKDERPFLLVAKQQRAQHQDVPRHLLALYLSPQFAVLEEGGQDEVFEGEGSAQAKHSALKVERITIESGC